MINVVNYKKFKCIVNMLDIYIYKKEKIGYELCID